MVERADSMALITWLILREPRCVPELKGPFPGQLILSFLREVMEARPSAHITVLRWRDGLPIVDDGAVFLQMNDGRSMARGRRHIASNRAAHEDPEGSLLARLAAAGAPIGCPPVPSAHTEYDWALMHIEKLRGLVREAHAALIERTPS